MYSSHTLFTKKQATAVINLMLDNARATGNNKDMSMREVYEAMQNNRYTIEDWDGPDADVYEKYMDEHDIPCITFAEVQNAFDVWVAHVDGRPMHSNG
jgi:hypothetical protein